MGGLEAAEEVCAGNTGGVTWLFDCRGDNRIDRWGNYHSLAVPDDAGYQQLTINRLGLSENGGRTFKYMREAEAEFTPIMNALSAGASCLVFCLNGKNRSVALCATVITGLTDPRTVPDAHSCASHAISNIKRLRALAEFTGIDQRHVDTTFFSPLTFGHNCPLGCFAELGDASTLFPVEGEGRGVVV